jgi:regulator of replication initiation timing
MFTTIITLLSSSAITAVITWLIGKHKTEAEIERIKAETDTIQLKNLKEVVDIYKKISDDLKVELQELKTEMTSLKIENHTLRVEIQKLQKTMHNQ